jgi:lactoylglutathione lyase
MGSISGIYHGGITVSDMEQSLRFYRDGLGLEIEFDKIVDGPCLPVVLDLDFDHIRAVYLRVPGGQFVELLEYHGIERLPAASRPCDYGAGHLCFYVDEIDGLYGRMRGLGFRARSDGVVAITEGPNQGARSIYMLDPDGYRVELLQKRPGA